MTWNVTVLVAPRPLEPVIWSWCGPGTASFGMVTAMVRSPHESTFRAAPSRATLPAPAPKSCPWIVKLSPGDPYGVDTANNCGVPCG